MDVVTLTLNPCVDRTLWVEEFGGVPVKEEFQSGGKGVNVARVLTSLGASCMAIAPVGGQAGERFCALASAEGVELTVTRIVQETRTVDTYVRMCDGVQRVEVGAPPAMSEAEIEALYRAALSLLPGARLFAVCGSACCTAAAQLGARLIARAKALGVHTLLDSNGQALLQGAAALPDLIKPNALELAQLVGHDVPDGMEESAAMALIARGIPRLLVSLGERGAALFTEASAIYCPAPKVRAVNPVGSGDSFVAGYIYAQLRGANEYASLSYACAAGAANAMVFPAARVRKHEIEQILGYAL